MISKYHELSAELRRQDAGLEEKGGPLYAAVQAALTNRKAVPWFKGRKTAIKIMNQK